MNEYEQNKREYPHAHQKQLMKEGARDANMVPPNNGSNVKRSTGIPRSFLQAASADTPGAKINPQGKFVLHFFQYITFMTFS